MEIVRTIASRHSPLLIRVRKLAADPASYRKLGELWLEGDHLCTAYLRRGGAPAQALITEAGWEQPALRQLASRVTNVAIVPAVLMAALSGLESAPPMGFVVAWEGTAPLLPSASSVVLDRLQDAGNVGTIMRSAAAFDWPFLSMIVRENIGGKLWFAAMGLTPIFIV